MMAQKKHLWNTYFNAIAEFDIVSIGVKLFSY